jgi:hypothetical protein
MSPNGLDSLAGAPLPDADADVELLPDEHPPTRRAVARAATMTSDRERFMVSIMGAQR